MLKKNNLMFVILTVMLSGCIFNGDENDKELYTISGTILSENNEEIPEVTISVGSQIITTDVSGYYSIDLQQGTYTIIPSKTNVTFLPERKEITVNADIMVDFVGIEKDGTTITITNPISGDSLNTGEKITISWNANASLAGKYDILLFLNGSYLFNIVSDYSQSTSYMWILPSIITANSNYSIRVRYTENTSIYGEVTNIKISPKYEPAETAQYKVIFTSIWSSDTHPLDFPSNPHFSGLIGAVHNDNSSLWEVGGLSSPGIKRMAEAGAKDPLSSEVETMINNGDAYTLLSGHGITPSPGSVSLNFTVHIYYSRVTLVSMVAPSPDWFIGVSGLNLVENNDWVSEKHVELYVYDAGTDAGETFTTEDQPIESPEKIKILNEYAFTNNGTAIPAGYFTFIRQQEVKEN
ncbi:MAG: spondin domain-containing protein [Candidatus Latescibacteria bacterium]|nr:spondin domain-containing protein [Candidatus Latescibacterota bacterium]